MENNEVFVKDVYKFVLKEGYTLKDLYICDNTIIPSRYNMREWNKSAVRLIDVIKLDEFSFKQ